MPSILRYVESLPDGASHRYDDDAGQVLLAWVRSGPGYLRIERVPEGAATFQTLSPRTPEELLREKGGVVRSLDIIGSGPLLGDPYHHLHSRLWRYWITTPDMLLEGVRRFVAAAEAGGLPDDWTEKKAEDEEGIGFTVCSFTLGMDGARSLGAEQEAMMALGDLPADVHFFQRVAEIQGFSGIEKKSRQPDDLFEPVAFAPSELFQTNHPAAADRRGATFDESDVLSHTGLTLL